MTDLRYPIGKFDANIPITPNQRPALIKEIAEAPAQLRAALSGLTNQQLDTPYRPEGWTVRQVVHHLPDSHINAYVRWRLALTETEPLIKPYNETLWAELPDAKTAPVESSVQLLESLHERWVILLRSLKPEDFLKTYRHPEYGVRNLDYLLGIYAWHGRHHVAHITSLRERMGWK
jgi:hypothetical protein